METKLLKLNKKALLDSLKEYHQLGVDLCITDYVFWKLLSSYYYNFDDYANIGICKSYLLDKIISRYLN